MLNSISTAVMFQTATYNFTTMHYWPCCCLGLHDALIYYDFVIFIGYILVLYNCNTKQFVLAGVAVYCLFYSCYLYHKDWYFLWTVHKFEVISLLSLFALLLGYCHGQSNSVPLCLQISISITADQYHFWSSTYSYFIVICFMLYQYCYHNMKYST